MSLTRTEILNGNYSYPSDLVRLKTTNHFMERLEERGIGVDCIPKIVRVTKDNIYCGDAEGNELVNVVVRLKYTSSRYVFLCFNPRDGVLRTIWFKDKRNGPRNTGQDSKQAVPDAGNQDEILRHT